MGIFLSFHVLHISSGSGSLFWFVELKFNYFRICFRYSVCRMLFFSLIFWNVFSIDCTEVFFISFRAWYQQADLQCAGGREKREGENTSLITYLSWLHTHGIELMFNASAYALQFIHRRLCCRLHLLLFAIQEFECPTHTHTLPSLSCSPWVFYFYCVSHYVAHVTMLFFRPFGAIHWLDRFMLPKKNNRSFWQWQPNDTSKCFNLFQNNILMRRMEIINKNSRNSSWFREFQAWQHRLESIACVFVYSMNVYCLTLWFQLARNSFIRSFVRSLVHSFAECLLSFTIHTHDERTKCRDAYAHSIKARTPCEAMNVVLKFWNSKSNGHWSK